MTHKWLLLDLEAAACDHKYMNAPFAKLQEFSYFMSYMNNIPLFYVNTLGMVYIPKVFTALIEKVI